MKYSKSSIYRFDIVFYLPTIYYTIDRSKFEMR